MPRTKNLDKEKKSKKRILNDSSQHSLNNPSTELTSFSSNSAASSLCHHFVDESRNTEVERGSTSQDHPTHQTYSSHQNSQPTLAPKLSNFLDVSNIPILSSNLLQDLNRDSDQSFLLIPRPYHSSFLSFSQSKHPSSFFQSSKAFPKYISFSTISSSQSDFGININTTIVQSIDHLYNTYISTPIIFKILLDSTLPVPDSLPLFLSSIQPVPTNIKILVIQQQLSVFQSFGFDNLASFLFSKQSSLSDIQLFSTRLQNIYYNLFNLFQCVEQPVIQQRSQDWYNLRKSMITASEFGTALGCGAYTSQEQFIQKKINPNTPFQAFQIALDWGIMFEPILNLIYQIKNNTIIFDFGFLVHPKFPFFGASPDGITSDGIMVEFKAPYRRKLSDSFPMQYYYQIQGQLDVCNLLECDYVEARFDPIIYDYQDFLFTIFGKEQYCCLSDDDDDHQSKDQSSSPLSDSPKPDLYFGAIVQFSPDNLKKSYKYSSINPTIQQLDDFVSSNDLFFQNQGFRLYEYSQKSTDNDTTPTYFYKFWILHHSNYQSFRIFKNSPFFCDEIDKAQSIHQQILQKKQDVQLS